jgi:SAM-dependent methyltransferase
MPYVLDNAADETALRFSGLEACFDPGTFRHLDALGVGEGWRCLEVGGGGGSVARALSARVGGSGRVLVTDIDPRWTDRGRDGNVEVVRNDIVSDDLPGTGFDLVHARLVLIHLPERQKALGRMIEALRPGGWILVEDFDDAQPVGPDTSRRRAQGRPDDVALWDKVRGALTALLQSSGLDVEWGGRVQGLLREWGLGEVGAESHSRFWPGGSGWCRVQEANVGQLRDALVAAGGVTAGEIDAAVGLLRDPSFAVCSHVMVSTWGRTPLA